jgi:hypothetical protein
MAAETKERQECRTNVQLPQHLGPQGGKVNVVVGLPRSVHVKDVPEPRLRRCGLSCVHQSKWQALAVQRFLINNVEVPSIPTFKG